MFNLFRRNCLYNESIDPHCAYCAHCKPDNEYQGVCEFRGIVAMAGSCRRFSYDALRRNPPKPARIRGRFTDEDFFFEENEEPPRTPPSSPRNPQDILISDDLDAFSDLWEEDDASLPNAPEQEDSESTQPKPDSPESINNEEQVEDSEDEI